MRMSHSLLHPSALAIAGGIGAIVLATLMGFGMTGAGSMMAGGGMMGGYGPYGGFPGYHVTVGGGLFMLFWAFVVGALAGWIVALVYNAVVRQSSSNVTGPSTE
jgi:hypothetical protein